MSKLQEARDIIAAILLHRRGLTLTDTVIRDAANNAATALIPLLEGMPSDEPPPVRLHSYDPWTGEFVEPASRYGFNDKPIPAPPRQNRGDVVDEPVFSKKERP